jgi:hypothetical protein
MRMQNEDRTPKPQQLWVVLTRLEAWDLKMALDHYFTDDRTETEWHHELDGEGDEALSIEIEPNEVPVPPNA